MVTFSNAINSNIGANIAGATNTLTVQNPSNTASSSAVIHTTIGGTTATNVLNRFAVGNSNSFAWGMQGGLGTTLRLWYQNDGAVTPGNQSNNPIRFETVGGVGRTVVVSGMAIADGGERSGSDVNLFMLNSNAVANSNVTFNMQTVAGGGFMAHALNGVGYNWQWGNNAPVDQNWQLLSGVNAGFGVGTQCMVVTQAGEVTFPNTPAFGAQLSGADANVTGAGATYNIGTNVAFTELFDQNADFNTNGTFTAPVTGRYQLNGIFSMTALTAAMTTGTFRIVTSNRIYTHSLNTAAVRTVATTADTYIGSLSVLADMDAADTAILQILILGGAGNTAGLAAFSNKFSGFLAC